MMKRSKFDIQKTDSMRGGCFFSTCIVTKRRQAYSPYLLVSQLPSTVMPDDIRRMAVSEGSMSDIIYHRNNFMEFQNRVTIVFRSSTDAVEFITQKYGKFMGGHKLNMSMVSHPPWCGNGSNSSLTVKGHFHT